ncbi:MAG: imidazoleglycerol-phosphate dehydratase HisB [Alphaproteobacteria bacterium]|nr:imidazoleglycerol-phosphate dehydratase HisB [Alphaproteobacteria bacterium]
MSQFVRSAEVTRATRETRISLSVNIDGHGVADVSTGIGFFDHMLESFSKHSAIDLTLKAEGDLHVDAHHTVEDVGIVLGQTIREAAGSYAGITRFGHSYVPMDETLVRASVDMCNRPYLIWRLAFCRDKVGDLDTELFKEFFQALAMNSGACLHLELLYGENSHHIAEASFKSVARALRSALVRDDRLNGSVASTKGSL